MNIGPKDRENIRSTALKFLCTPEGTLESAFDELLIRHYSIKNRNGELVQNNVVPTFSQFVYWTGQLISTKERIVGKEGVLNYKRKSRMLHGKANDHVLVAGLEYQVDWAKYPIQIVSSINRNRAIGTLLVYFIRDVATRMIVGYYATIENASYATGALALEQALYDKDKWAKRSNLEMEPGAWPCSGKPYVLYADRGEFASLRSDIIPANLDISIANAPPYRPDLKSTVEISFKIGKNRIRPHTKGYGLIASNQVPQTTNASKKLAALSLEDMNQIILDCILEANSDWLDDYPLTEEMRANEIDPIPNELWKWFEERGECKVRSVDENKIRYLLLPQEECRLHRGGLRFHGMDYVPIDKKAFDLAEGLFLDGFNRAMIAFDPRMLAQMFFVHKQRFYQLRPRGLNETKFNNYWELLLLKARYEDSRAEHKEIHDKRRRQNTERIRGIRKNARKKQLVGGAKAGNVRQDREQEKIRNRQKNFALVPSVIKPKQSSSVASKYSGRKDHTAISLKHKK